MHITDEQLENWFTYHLPTDETRPKYARLAEGYDYVLRDFHSMWKDALNSQGGASQEHFVRLRSSAKAFASLIVSTCPPSVDTTAAVRHVREAVMQANRALQLSNLDTEPSGLARYDFTMAAMASLELAKVTACAAVACGGK